MEKYGDGEVVKSPLKKLFTMSNTTGFTSLKNNSSNSMLVITPKLLVLKKMKEMLSSELELLLMLSWVLIGQSLEPDSLMLLCARTVSSGVLMVLKFSSELVLLIKLTIKVLVGKLLVVMVMETFGLLTVV